MRRINGPLSIGIIVLFLIHASVGILQMAGLMQGGSKILSVLSWIMVILIGVHIIIGIKLTADTLKSINRSKAGYPRQNRLFWVRRISGAAVILFIAAHIIVFMGDSSSGAFRLNLFDGVRLAEGILLALSLGLHIITNIRPIMLGLGIKGFREVSLDILLIVSVILLISAAAFVVYYIRWKVF